VHNASRMKANVTAGPPAPWQRHDGASPSHREVRRGERAAHHRP
jgi:hypothetical protein